MASCENFDSTAYLNEYFVLRDFYENVFTKYREVFHQGDGLPGSRLLDFGCGPTLAYVLAVSDNFTDIVMADYAESNVKVLQKWKETGEYHFDWSNYYDLIIQSSNKSELEEKYETRLKQVRNHVKEILQCDANRSDPVTPSHRGTFDVLISNFAIEVAPKTRADYKQCIKNVMTLLKPGGKLVMTTVCDESFWDVGGKRLHCMPVDKELVLGALDGAGMTDVKTETTHLSAWAADFCDGKYYLVITATKL